MIGVLSAFKNPLLPGYLAALNRLGISDYVVICDSKEPSENQRSLFFERLGGWSVEEHFNSWLAKDHWMNPFYFVESHNSESSIALVSKLKCSFLLNAGTPRKLDLGILNSTSKGVLNVHPGMLPNYRGKNCPEWAVYNNDQVFVTAHLMGENYDEGDVLGTDEVYWRSLESYVEFRKQVHIKSFDLAANISLGLLNNTCQILYSSNSSKDCSCIRDSMDAKSFELVKGRFSRSNRGN